MTTATATKFDLTPPTAAQRQALEAALTLSLIHI